MDNEFDEKKDNEFGEDLNNENTGGNEAYGYNYGKSFDEILYSGTEEERGEGETEAYTKMPENDVYENENMDSFGDDANLSGSGFSAYDTYENIREEVPPVYNKTEEFTQRRNAERYEEHIKEPNKKKKSGGGWKKAIVVAVIIGVLGGLFSGIGYGIAKNKSSKETLAVTNSGEKIKVRENPSFNYSGIYSAKDIIKSVSPAVVNINVEAQGTTTYWGMYEIPYSYQGAGSGVIFSENENEVYIITNSHVIEDSTKIYVTLDEAENVPATLIGNDSAAELAVLSISKSDLTEQGVENITIASLGDSDLLEVGDNVIAIGNALGLGKVSTGGMISALGKEINIEGKSLEVIQTDAAINEGNSGGALVNQNGEVIGINTAKSLNMYASTSIEGMGYAIPINTAKPIIENLLIEGTSEKPYLGIVGQSVTNDLAKVYGLPMGVYVAQVLEGSAAEKGGIKVGDVIIEFNGTKVIDMDVLVDELKKTEVDEKVKVKLIRNDEAVEVNVTIADANER